jgi:tetratricopeptide (TPR) repeat protein
MRTGHLASSAAFLALILGSPNAVDAQQPTRRMERVVNDGGNRGRAGDRWAVVVGVDRYADARIPALSGAVADAGAIRDVLVESAEFPESQVLLLVSDGNVKPTQVAILDTLDEVKRGAKPGDLLLFFFAGHGVEVDGRRYMLTYDAQCCGAASIKSTALLASTLMQELESIKVTNRIIMIDACRTDPTKPGKQLNVVDERFEAAFTLQPAGEGGLRATFLASSRGQSAYEWGEKRRGFFSYFIEQGMRGEAAQFGKVTVTSLLTYLNEMVPRSVREQKGQVQVPYARVDGSEFVLVQSARLRKGPSLDQPSRTQYRTIYGVVKDSGGAPLGGTRIVATMANASRAVAEERPSRGNEVSAITDDDGFFKIEGVGADAQVKITIAKNGYLPQERLADPRAAGKKLDIFLARQVPQETPQSPKPSTKPSPAVVRAAAPVVVADSRSAELGRVAYQTFLAEEFSEAERVAREAVTLDKYNVLANAVLGNAMAVLGANTGDAAKLKAAMEFIRNALQDDERQALAHNALGLTLVTEAKYDEAAAALKTAIGLDPTLWAAHANLAYVFQQQKRLDQAEREYREAIRLQPDGAVAYNNLSTVLFDRKKYKDAINASRDAISRYQLQDSFLGKFYVQLAIAQFQDGRQSEALEAVGRAKALGINDHEAYATIESAKPAKK